MGAQRELSNEYQHDRVEMFFKNLYVLVLRTRVASALEGLCIGMDTQYNTKLLILNGEKVSY